MLPTSNSGGLKKDEICPLLFSIVALTLHDRLVDADLDEAAAKDDVIFFFFLLLFSVPLISLFDLLPMLLPTPLLL